MDDTLNRPPRPEKRLCATLSAALAVFATLASAGAAADSLPDPTRPPAQLMSGAAGGAAGGPRLQSVLVGAQGRRVAVIDGDTYRVGDHYKGARVAAVGEAEVVLVQGRQKQVLKLFPESLPAALSSAAAAGTPAVTPAVTP